MSATTRRDTQASADASTGRLSPAILVAGGATVLVIVAVVLWAVSRGSAPLGGGQSGDVGIITRVASGPAATKLLAPGSSAPDFSWQTAGGTNHSLAGLRGQRVVLLDFLATWCPHCQRHAPVVAAIYRQYQARGVEVLGINASRAGMDQRSPTSPDDMARFAAQFGADYPLAFDPTTAVGRRYGVRAFPATVIVDRQGTIRYSFSGEAPEADLAAALDAVLR